MLLGQFFLKDAVVRLRNYTNLLNKNTDIDNLKSRFYGICFDFMLALEESAFTLGDYKYSLIKSKVYNLMHSFKDIEDALKLKEEIEIILEDFPEDMDYGAKSVRNFSPGVYDSITSSNYSINSSTIDEVMKSVVMPERLYNIIDPNCKDGINLLNIKSHVEDCKAYGMESDNYLSSQAKLVLDKVAIGSLIGSRISNDVFDIMLLNPSVKWDISNTDMFRVTNLKAEKTFIQNTTKYLRPNGLLILAIPYFRVQKDTASYLAKNYENIQIRKTVGRDFKDKGLIIITGTRARDKEIDQEVYNKLRNLHSVNNIKDIFEEPFEKYNLPSKSLEVDMFRGSVLDMDEMENIVDESGCMESFWDSQSEDDTENTTRPLLPFNLGQIGLVLTSGCLDGIVEEGDGNLHLIKGRVSKKSDTESDVPQGDRMEVNETVSNKVEINVLLPDGEYKVLA